MHSIPLRIGILGAGRWARTVHVPHLRELPGVKLVAASSNSLEHRQALRDAWGGPLCFYEDPLDLLEDELDGVIVCTPNDTHEPLSLAALERGKHVFCEKPPALTREGVERIAAARERAGRVFAVDLELRYSDVARRMRELIRAGEIGPPKLLHCLLLRNYGTLGGWRDDPAISGGLWLELGIHYLDLLSLLAGAPPARVFATAGHALAGRLPDYAACTVEYENEARASFSLALFARARNEIRLQVVGTEGMLEGEIMSGEVRLSRREAAEPEDRSPARAADLPLHGYPGAREALRDWIDSILQGRAPCADIEVGREATAVCLAAEESVRSGGVEGLGVGC